MKLVFHAGIHRTGTTSLQRCLEQNRHALSERGIAYPGEGKSHQPLAWSLKRGQSDGSDVADLLSAVSNAHTAVLSGEDFCIHTDLAWLATVAKRYETSAVFYLRRQDHWLMSWYNQHVKWPFNRKKSRMDPREFLRSINDFYWLDYSQLYDRWVRILGPDRVLVRVVESGQTEDVSLDFLSLVGVDPDGLSLDQGRQNDSLPVHLLEVARLLGLYDLKPRERQRVLNALRRGLADKAVAARTVYSPEERNAVIARFRISNRSLAHRAFGREELFFEPDVPPDAPYFQFPDIGRVEFTTEWIQPFLKSLLRPDRGGS